MVAPSWHSGLYAIGQEEQGALGLAVVPMGAEEVNYWCRFCRESTLLAYGIGSVWLRIGLLLWTCREG